MPWRLCDAVNVYTGTEHRDTRISRAIRCTMMIFAATENGEKTMENEVRLIERIKRFWERYFKPHCPDCGGIMDGDQFDMEIDKVVYTCRDCNKEWV